MNEQRRLACIELLRMLQQLRGSSSDRRFRLFACACCRRIWDLLPDPANRGLVSAVEDHPDGSFHDPEVYAAAVASSAREHELRVHPAYWVAKYLGRGFYKMTAADSALVVALKVASLVDKAEVEMHAGLVRDIFGSLPFRTARLDAAWRTPLVQSLARAAYEGRVAPDPSRPGWLTLDRNRLLVLADALEEAGCDDADILGHCRQPGPHVRGCWLVDLLTGRS
jgi:hypothetical protein